MKVYIKDFSQQFTEEMAERMLELMLEDLCAGRKEEYNSEVGLAILFDRAGGKLTPVFSDVIVKVNCNFAVFIRPIHSCILFGISLRNMFSSIEHAHY